MPELPEVETVMRGLAIAMAGRRIARVQLRRADLRFPFPPRFAERLTGQRIGSFRRRAKYILAEIESGDCLLVHLGMSGRFAVRNGTGRTRNLGELYFEGAPQSGGEGAHDHVVFDLDDGTRITYSDPRRFGVMDLVAAGGLAQHRLLKDLGVEPLGNEFNADHLAERFAGKKAPLKAALLDQTLVAGLGNIYVCEALYRAGLSPRRKAGSLVKRGKADPRLEELARHIKVVLEEAIEAGGSTLRDFVQTDGKLGAFQERFSVYDREGKPCPRCSRPIRRIVQAGRSTFFCASCQK
jgi:formamidopyrimidine-DNA glycosylase